MLNWSSASYTHIGNVRERNEDAFLNRPDAGLWAVADGMGGHLHGDVASKKTIDALDAQTKRNSLEDRVDDIAVALDSVNKELIDFVQHEDEVCGTTIAILLIEQGEAACLWAGDSRIYQLRQGQLVQITHDHIDQGDDELDEFEETATFLDRAIGKDDDLLIDLLMIDPQDGDRYLLCTDGLYGDLSIETMQEILLSSQAPKLAASRLIEAALENTGNDNITAVVVDFEVWD